MSDVTVQQEMRAIRQRLIEDLCATISRLAMTPGIKVDEKCRLAFREMLEGYEQAVLAVNSSTSSSWAFRDLTGAEAEHYKRAKHALSLLDIMNGDQEK